MITKNTFYIILLCFSIVSVGKSQIITSKKEAIKKGVYLKPIEVKKEVQIANKIAFEIAENPLDEFGLKEIKEVKPKENRVVKSAIAKKALINEQDDDDILFTPAQNYLATQLINNAMQFVGVRYRSGGTSLAGMDCSGFVTAAFNIFDLKLPRSSIDMSRVGDKIDPSDAKKGDLIFFKTQG